MRPLRNLSARPTIVVDDRARRVADPSGNYLGIDGPLGRERVVFALPINGTGPWLIAPPEAVHDADGFYLADPNGVLVGLDGLWIPRMIGARWTLDTRRLAG